jgi:Fe-S-cluster containining protein
MDLKSVAHLDWPDYCDECSYNCCYDTNLYVSPEELARLGVTKVVALPTEGSPCMFLDQNSGKCTVYDRRPFDCRLFPLDIDEVDGKLWWLLSTECPAHGFIDAESSARHLEQTLLPEFGEANLRAFVAHYKRAGARGHPLNYMRIREVRF